jgi:hypothetical protein
MKMKVVLPIGLVGVVLAGLPGSAFAAPLFISAMTNIGVAGQDTTGVNTMGGLFPTAISITPGAGQTIGFSSITGTTTCGTGMCNPAGGIGPDGASLTFPTGNTDGTNIANDVGISGIKFTGREMGLVGVFLDASTNPPTGFGPFQPSFCSTGCTYNADTDTTFLPFFIGQVFWIGDGRTGVNQGSGAGTEQKWQIPTTANRLYLGFADSFNNFSTTGSGGTPSYSAYGDNTGGLNVTLDTSGLTAAPEPGTLALLGLGFLGLGILRKRLA